ncbi:MAG TPA: DUF1614 domain-containing protein [Clostridia bacterium]|nr:DUF1614 domain-containing protein [Clostridia bacterium]
MGGFSIGLIVLFIVSLLIYFGLAHRVLDRLRLSDRGALLVIVAIILGSFIDIPIPGTGVNSTINVGGAIIPIGLAVYLIVKAGTAKEKTRSIVAAVITALAIYGVGSLLMTGLQEPAGRFALLDMIYVIPLVAGLTAYIFGRSRRASFVAAVLGVLTFEIFYMIWAISSGAPATARVSIGGAGAFDTMILAGILAVLLAEVIGETRERLQGGPKVEGRPEELLEELKNDKVGDLLGLNKVKLKGKGGKDEENN